MALDMASDTALGTGWDKVSGTASDTALGKGSDKGFVSFRHNHKGCPDHSRHNHKGCPDHSLREFESWKKDKL